MAEFDQYLEGIPEVRPSSGGSVFSSSTGMSPRQRHFLASERLKGQSVILDTQERIAALKDREASRVQGQRAMSVLSELDPLTDPDYDRKVMGVLSQNPAATLDRTVANFLGVQGGLFEKAETGRKQIEDEARQKILDRERSDETLRREDARIRQEVGLRRDLEAETMISNLPTPLLTKFDSYRTEGLDQRTALKRTMEDAEGEAEINELRAMGLGDTDIEGLNDPITGTPLLDASGKPLNAGLLDPKTGRVDPARKAKLIGDMAIRDKEKKQKEELDKQVERRLGLLTKQLQKLDRYDDADLPMIEAIQGGINRANEQLGLLTPTTGEAKVGGQTEEGSMKDTSKVIPRKDVLPSDRFIP